MLLSYWFWTTFFFWSLYGIFDLAQGNTPPPKWWPWIGFVLLTILLLVLGLGEFGEPVKSR